jgi:hypothetical protein
MLMIRDDLHPAMRRKILRVVGAFAMAGCAALWLGSSGMMPFLRSLNSGARLVSFRPSDLIPLPLAISMFAFAAMCLIPAPPEKPRDRRQRQAAARTWRAAAVLPGVAAAGIVMAVAAAADRPDHPLVDGHRARLYAVPRATGI